MNLIDVGVWCCQSVDNRRQTYSCRIMCGYLSQKRNLMLSLKAEQVKCMLSSCIVKKNLKIGLFTKLSHLRSIL